MAVRRFAYIFGGIYLVIGLLGFVPGLALGSSFDNFGPGGGRLLGLFPVNYVHDVVHALIGIAGLAAGASVVRSVSYARILGIAYVVLAIAGATSFAGIALPTDAIVPIGEMDVILHLLSGLVALFFGFGPPSRAAIRP